MRNANWDKDLRCFISENMHTPFQWGVFDCVLFSARCADAITDHEYAAPFIGTYHTKVGAAKVIKEHLGGLFPNVFDSYYRPTPAQLARSGDIVLCIPPTTMDPTYGIADGDKIFVSGPIGLTSFRTGELLIENAWRVE